MSSKESNATLAPGARLVRNGDIVAAPVDGELVMISVERGSYYGLDEVGSRVWELLAEPRLLSEIVSVLVEEYDVEPAVCEQEVAALVRRFVEERMVSVV